MSEPTDAASTQLATLADEFWDRLAEAQPLNSTARGDRRFDDRIDDITPEAVGRERRRLEAVAAAARGIPEAALSAADRVTRGALIDEAAGSAEMIGLGLEAWTVDPLEGWHIQIQSVASYQPVATPDQARAMVRRWHTFGRQLDRVTENLRRGLADDRVAVRTPVTKVIAALTDTLATPDAKSPFLVPLRETHDDWSQSDRSAFAEGLTSALHDEIRPALARYRELLARDVLPRSRPDETPGLIALPGGEGAYRTLVRYHTTLDVSPGTLHETGLAEVARINAETEALGRRALGAANRPDTLRRLREDPAMHFATREEVAGAATTALARAQAATPDWFGRLPATPCVVVPMPAHEEEHSTIAYYREAAVDGSRPGEYYINTSHPETRPRYEAECLAYHEAVPGHHLQIALAQEMRDLPAFRRHLGPTAFFEGWGLYTERLADEMGLYSGDVDRLGMLSMDAWRACRLVVDTGIHALGWTRQQAIDYMIANTALAPNNIANEVDRYIVWPGQALAYKAGQLEMLRLRAEAQETLRDRFDVRSFHDAVLGNGAIALGTLGTVVRQWVAERRH